MLIGLGFTPALILRVLLVAGAGIAGAALAWWLT
jgi:hypothetical protein